MPTPKQYKSNAVRQKAYRTRQALARQNERHVKGLPPAPLIPTLPAARRWSALATLAQEALHTIRDEMDAYYNDRTETWQQSERGEALLERIQSLEDLLDIVCDQTT